MIFNQIKLPCFAVMIILVSLLGCGKSSTVASFAAEDMVALQLVVAGIESNQSDQDLAKQSKRQSEVPSHGKVYAEVPLADLGTAILSVNKTVASTSRNWKPKLQAASVQVGKTYPMDADIVYKVLLYDQQGNLFSNTLCLSGKASNIMVAKGATYTVVAYSVNSKNSADLPELAADNLSILTPQDKDLMYASAHVSVPLVPAETGVPLRISFKHKTAKIAAIIDSRGVFSKIKTLKGSVVSSEPLTQGLLNLRDGDVSAVRAYVPPAFDYNLSVAQDSVELAYHSVLDGNATATIPGLTVNITQMQLDRAEGSKTYAPTRPYQFDFRDLNMEIGTAIRARVNLIEAGFQIGNVMWANYNLYYENSAYKFRSAANQGLKAYDSDYWVGGSLLPEGPAAAADPCSQVYPLNSWRLPTFEEIEVIKKENSANLTFVSNREALGSEDYVEITNGEGKTNRFYALGFYATGEVHTAEGTTAPYWTSTTTVVGGVVYRRSLTFFVYPASFDIIHENWIETNNRRFNIRCVRDFKPIMV